ncbi:MAG: alkaline phosphatase family protein [Candidatus Nanohaloarchaea archaeon]
MTEDERVLIVAFDGLDKEKIEEFGCENLMQEEFGKIDITDHDRLGTPWLWASFLTGQKHEFRAVKRLNNDLLERMEVFFWKHVWPMKKWAGLRTKLLRKIPGIHNTNHTREDLEAETFLEKIGAPGYYVPAYNEYPFNEFSDYASLTVEALGGGKHTREEVVKKHRELFLRQKEELLRLIENDVHNSFMFYFKYPDAIQHLLFNGPIDYAGEDYGIEEMYHELDDLAGDIRDAAPHELVLFLSDHGLEDGDHNLNAFYSSNQEIEIRKPELTDFHSLILENASQSRGLGDIDI